MPLKETNIARFQGLTNKVDPLRRQGGEGGAGMSVADNVDLDDTGKLRRAEGYERVYSGVVTDLYVTEDEQRAYIVEDRDLKQLHPDWSIDPLWPGLSRTYLHWAEVNDVVYATNGADYLVIGPEQVREWGIPTPDTPHMTAIGGGLPAGRYQVTATRVADDGRESGAPMGNIIDLDGPGGIRVEAPTGGYRIRIYITSVNGATFYRAYETDQAITTWSGPLDALVDPLQTQFLSSPPGGSIVGYRLGRLYLGQYFPEANQSAIWPSQPLGFEHFDLLDAFLVPGEIRAIVGHPQGLILGCRDAVHVYDEEQGIQQLADYGVVPGWTPAWHRGRWYLWTQRGLVRALPFEEVTRDTVSVAPGIQGCGHVLERGGFDRYVAVVEDGGEPHNAY